MHKTKQQINIGGPLTALDATIQNDAFATQEEVRDLFFTDSTGGC
jgi:hypothetical protein